MVTAAEAQVYGCRVAVVWLSCGCRVRTYTAVFTGRIIHVLLGHEAALRAPLDAYIPAQREV